MFCTSCGARVSEHDTFCLKCGARIGSDAPAASLPAGLRPLGVGERIDAAIKVYRANFVSMIKALAVVVVIVALLQALVQVSLPTQAILIRHTDVFGNPSYSIDTSTLWPTLSGLALVQLLAIFAFQWASAVCVQIVGGSIVDSPVEWRVARRRATVRLGSILWIQLLIFVIVLVPGLALSVLAILAGVGAPVLAFIVLLFGGIAYLVFAIWFDISQTLAVPSLMLEDTRGLDAVRRSLRLVRGSWWSVFGTFLLVALMVGVAQFAVGVIVDVGTQWLSHGTGGHYVAQAVRFLFTLAITTPFWATIFAILSIDMRVRKEGLDIELLARQINAPASDPSSRASTAEPSSFPQLESPPASGASDDEPPADAGEGAAPDAPAPD
jgi:hypothetical protein